MLVASPRNQQYLVYEVVGFRRPLFFLGQTQHSGQISFQNDCGARRRSAREFSSKRRRTAFERLPGCGRRLSRPGTGCSLFPIEVGDVRVEQERRFRLGEFPLQFTLSCFQCEQFLFDRDRREPALDRFDELPNVSLASRELGPCSPGRLRPPRRTTVTAACVNRGCVEEVPCPTTTMTS